MKKNSEKKERRIVRINGVKIVNAENVKAPERDGKDADEGTSNFTWSTDNNNLQL